VVCQEVLDHHSRAGVLLPEQPAPARELLDRDRPPADERVIRCGDQDDPVLQERVARHETAGRRPTADGEIDLVREHALEDALPVAHLERQRDLGVERREHAEKRWNDVLTGGRDRRDPKLQKRGVGSFTRSLLPLRKEAEDVGRERQESSARGGQATAAACPFRELDSELARERRVGRGHGRLRHDELLGRARNRSGLCHGEEGGQLIEGDRHASEL
jgi:hypothetical protein